LHSSAPADWLLVIVGLGGIVAALCTLRAINRQAIATETAALAAKQSADTSERALRITQRAYLYVIAVEFRNFSEGHFPTVAVQIKNSGHLAATLTSWAINVITRDPFPAGDQRGLEWQPHSVTIAPEQTATVTTEPPGRPFDAQEWAGVQSGEYGLRVYGAFRYRAGFDIDGETGFGSVFTPSTQGLPLHRRFSVGDVPGYNYAD
jgi:hypothetical protein